MSTYKTKSGATLTDDEIERLGEAAERGEYPGTPGDLITITPVVAERTQYAHMPQHRSHLVTIAFKVPRSHRDALDRRAEAQGETRSQFMREALERALT